MIRKVSQKFKGLLIKFSEDTESCHEIFMKEHSAQEYDENKPEGRTLYLINVPPYITNESLERIFHDVGPLQSVTCEEKDGHHFKVAYVVFKKSSSVVRALKLRTVSAIHTEECPILTGVEKWIQEYNNSILNHESLQQEVDQFMAEYDKSETERKMKEKLLGNEDEEGWTVVTKNGRRPGFSRKESVENRVLEKTMQKTKRKQLKNFYSFQIRETKMNHVAKLREKFEEDKKRIAAFKQSRKFKPF